MERERNIFEISQYIAEYARTLIQALEQGKLGRLEEEINIQKFRELRGLEDEMESEVESLTGSERERQIAAKIAESTRKGFEAYEEGELEKFESHLKRIIELDRELYSDVEDYDLTDIETVSEIGRGAEAVVYKTDKDGVLLKVWELSVLNLKDLKRYFKKQQRLPEEVNFSRILKTGIYEGDHPAAMIERLPGNPVHREFDEKFGSEPWSSNISELSELPVESFRKLLADFSTLRKFNIFVDNRPNNLFLDTASGQFYLLDLDGKNPLIMKHKRESGEQMNFLKPEALYDAIFNTRKLDKPKDAASNISWSDYRNMKDLSGKMQDAGFRPSRKIRRILNYFETLNS